MAEGVCRNGQKDYEDVLGLKRDVGMMPTSKRGMYCECPDDNPNALEGMSGIHCTSSYERCGDGSVCFNGGFCERDSNNMDLYHCGCPQDDKYKVWAGKTCENPATAFCSKYDAFYDLSGSRWFCTNGGRCIDGETNLSKKCECEPGFYGLHCEYDDSHSCDLECFNGGECKKGAKDVSQYIEYGLDIDEFLGGSNDNGQHCVCPQGFTGVQCELEDGKHYRSCGSGVCFNKGVCVERVNAYGSPKDYHCECNEFDKTAGEFCEHTNVEFCPAPDGHDALQYYCANGGSCPLSEPHQPCTNCDEGWTGPRCETKVQNKEVVDERKECDLDCRNGGTCFFGDHPLEDTSTLKQIPGLEFLQDNKHCRCPSGYIGLRCEMRYERCGAGEHYCLHGSGCVSDNDQFTCDCNEVSTSLVAYAGHYCEHTAAEFCQGPGAGKHSFCTQHGKCRGQIGLGEDHVGCDCDDGWAGDYCEYQIEQLRTDGIATKVFVAFMLSLVAVVCLAGGFYCFKVRKNDRSSYEHAANHDVHANPYGDDNDSDSDSDDEYELKEVTII